MKISLYKFYRICTLKDHIWAMIFQYCKSMPFEVYRNLPHLSPKYFLLAQIRTCFTISSTLWRSWECRKSSRGCCGMNRVVVVLLNNVTFMNSPSNSKMETSLTLLYLAVYECQGRVSRDRYVLFEPNYVFFSLKCFLRLCENNFALKSSITYLISFSHFIVSLFCLEGAKIRGSEFQTVKMK